MKSFSHYLRLYEDAVRILNEDSNSAQIIKLYLGFPQRPEVMLFMEKIRSPFFLKRYLESFRKKEITDLIKTVTKMRDGNLRFAIFVKNNKLDVIFVWDGDVLHNYVITGIEQDEDHPGVFPSYSVLRLYKQTYLLWDEVSNDVDDWCFTGTMTRSGDIETTLDKKELQNMEKSVHYKALFGM